MIIVCPSEVKDSYLAASFIHNYKFYSLSEMKEKVFYKYCPLALYEVSKKYNVKPSIASRILESLYYVNNNFNFKTGKLLELKEYLFSKNLIIRDNNFFTFLHDEITIEGYPKTKELDKIIDILSKYTKVTYKGTKNKYELKSIYSFNSIEEEIEYVSENILELIDRGIDINKIVLINYNDEYKAAINKLFSLFKLPFNINSSKSIMMFPLTKKFLDFIKNSDLKISELNEFLDTLKGDNDEILNQIINVLNKYYSINDSVKNLYEIITYELNRVSFKEEKYTDVVNIYNGIKVFNDDFHVFHISSNEAIKYKDDEYLSDQDKELVGLNTSYELNIIDDTYRLNILSNIKNLYLSYKTHNGDDEYIIDHIFENLSNLKYEFKYNAKEYNKYLYTNYKLYDNSYNKIDFEDLKKYINNKMNLSYSSMEQYFKCKFRFFLNNILKVEPSESTMSTNVGEMFHNILERTLKNEYKDYLRIIDEESENYLNGGLKERFYCEKLKKEAIKIIERLEETGKKTDFKEYAFEETLEIPLDSKLDLKLKGRVDKILIYNDGTFNHVIVVDYKTGSYDIDLTNIKDGFGMQLLIYLYLINKSNYVENSKIAGAYIDHFLDELKPAEYGKTYEEINSSKLDGISTRNREILKHIDKDYDVNSYIKGMAITKDDVFGAHAKVYSDKNFDFFMKTVEDNIKDVVKSIEECDFEINPKRFINKPDEVVGCEYCTFKEICYMSAKDIKLIKKGNLEEMLGDNDGVDV